MGSEIRKPMAGGVANREVVIEMGSLWCSQQGGGYRNGWLIVGSLLEYFVPCCHIILALAL